MGGNKTPQGKVAGRDLGDEYLIYDRAADKVHVLNATAREIYLLCDGEHSAEAIAEAMRIKFEIDAELAARDTDQTLQELDALGVLEWKVRSV